MFQSISSDEFYQKEKSQQLAILDVREVDEFQNGHIPSAQNSPLSELDTHFSELDSDTAYYVICHSGGRSANACLFLAENGFDVTNVMGGMSVWKGAIE